MMTNLKLSSILFIAVFFLSSCSEQPQSKNPLGESDDVISVKVTSLAVLKVPNVIGATGLVSTKDEARYSFKIGGIISKILVDEGQFFKRGQLLAILNSTEIEAGLAQSTLGLDKAKRDYQRAKNLYRDSVYTLEQFQNTKTALDVAQKANDATAFNEHYSRIYASADGFVAKKIANEGEVIADGMPVLLTNSIERNNSYLLKVGVTDKEWGMITPGQKAKVSLDGFTGRKFDAVVFRKSQTADPQLGSFQIELKLKLNGTMPAVGMFGKAEIEINNEESAIVAPYDALVEADGYSAFVFIPNGANHVKKIPVTILKFDNEKVYLKNELHGINQIVVSNSAYLNEQSTIKIIK